MIRLKCLLAGCLFSQTLLAQMNIFGTVSLEYGDSENDFNFSEHRIDLNGSWNEWTSWIQFEYGKPPQLGRESVGLRKFRIDYVKDNFSFKVGDLYEYWGRGLMLNMVDDQSIDLDTGIRGGQIQWSNNIISAELLGGNQTIWRLTNQVQDFDDRIPNYKVDHQMFGGRIVLNREQWQGSVQFLKSNENHPNPAKSINEDVSHMMFGTTIQYFADNLDLNVDYVKKDKSGFGLYSNINLFVAEWSLGFTYKNYSFDSRSPLDRWDFVNNTGGALTIQQMPTGFKTHNTSLLGKITHVIDFNDEVGTYLTVSGPVFTDALFTFEWAKSSRHNEWYTDADWIWQPGKEVFLPSDNSLMNPFQEFYGELNGYAMNQQLYYVIGLTKTQDVLDIYLNSEIDNHKSFSYEFLNATTIPTHFTYRFDKSYSIDILFEYQEKKKGVKTFSSLPSMNQDMFTSLYLKDKQINRFLSIGVAKSPKWSVSLSVDYADTEERAVIEQERQKNALENALDSIWDTSLTWGNIEMVLNLNQNNRLSISYGSQRGGVYCSNGVCRYIQPFENGIKFGFVSTF